MITELVYKQYKRLWRASPWKSLDDLKLQAIAEYENAHREDIIPEDRFLDDSEIDNILGTVDGKYPGGCVRCEMGPGVTGNTACQDQKPENCKCSLNLNPEPNERSCAPCKTLT